MKLTIFKPKLALFDIDGVLADDRHRVDHALNKRWVQYFKPEALAADAVWPQGRALYERLRRRGWRIGYLTGRREDLRVVTEAWLQGNGYSVKIAPTMRGMQQRMPLANLKVEHMRGLIESGKYSKVVLFDDDPEVIRLVHAELGKKFAVHCTWHKKETALVKAATA